MTIAEIRNRVADYMKAGFTMKEAFQNMKNEAKTSNRKTNKVAEAKAASEERNGTTKYGWDGKSYGFNKWGKQ